MTEIFRQVLVHLDASAGTTHRLWAARSIARKHVSALRALYAVVPAYTGMPMTGLGMEFQSTLEQIDIDRRDAARKIFDEAASAHGPTLTWSETTDESIIGAFVQQALYADLLVLGQRNPSDPNAGDVPADFAEAVVMTSGKPALVIPYAAPTDRIGDNVVIAWKASRESARAVSASLPFLRTAAQVHIVSWGEPERAAVAGQALDLAEYLKLHGVKTTWHREPGEPAEVGELLLSRAFDLDADLLVMGCYGHSRTRELLLGGATRTILQSMTLPVLMAH